MKILNTVLVATFALTSATAVQAATLTFDDLITTYGDGSPLGSNMTGNSQFLSYTENGYVFTLNTANSPTDFFGAHIGDAGSAQTFNWHDNGDNLVGAFVTLTKVGGGNFNLQSLDYSSSGFTASALGYTSFLSGSGSAALNFNNVNSVTFSSDGYIDNSLDNVVLSAAGVPEPATWAMMLVGFGAMGVAMRRRQTAVSFA